jgi:hypothetical protein
MSLPDPENTRIDHPRVDSGVHIRDSERAPATPWQMFVVGLLVIALLCVFFYGLTEQRTEVAGTPQENSSVAAPAGQATQSANTPAPPPATTGAAPAR